MKQVALIDYGMSNLGSVKRAFEESDANCEIVTIPEQLEKKTHIVLPGVGSFADGMKQIRSIGWDEALKEFAVKRGIPLLGICLGMQLLVARGTEGGDTDGLGIIPGQVTKLFPQKDNERLPHIGWNEIYAKKADNLLKGIDNGSDFYFVHSFHVQTVEAYALTLTPYCGGFISSIQHNNIYGVQFHPEKSQRNGRMLLKNFLEI